MHCQTCDALLSPGRLFCVGCGAVTPEGQKVMAPRAEVAALPAIVGVPVAVSRPAGAATPTCTTAVVAWSSGC